MVKYRNKFKSPHRLPLSSSGDLRLVFNRQGGDPAAGEGDRFDFASKLDYQGASEFSGQGHSSFGQNEGMDFGRIFGLGEADPFSQTAEPKFTSEEEGAVEQWEEELKQFLAGVEAESNPFMFDTSVPNFLDTRQSVDLIHRG
jgi:hypothetical protein